MVGATHKQLNIGIIPYWNMEPLRRELSHASHGKALIKSGLPVEVNQWLKNGEVHLAPCSSVCLVTNAGHEMALPLGIASNGPVQSVYLGFKQQHNKFFEHITDRNKQFSQIFKKGQERFGMDARKMAKYIWEEIRNQPSLPISSCPPLKLSRASESSNYLTKILYNFWFGSEAYKIMSGRRFSKTYEEEQPIELVIGDEALVRKSSFSKTLDLGLVWKELTGLPFVFAVWQSRGTCLNGWRRHILELGEKAESKMKGDPHYYLPQDLPKDELNKPLPLPEYWKTIRYRLKADEMRGLLTFLCLTRELLTDKINQDSMVKILRWQEICHSGSIPQF